MLVHGQGIITLLNQTGIYNIKVFGPFFILNCPKLLSAYSPLAERPMQSPVGSVKTNTRSRIILSERLCDVVPLPAGKWYNIIYLIRE